MRENAPLKLENPLTNLRQMNIQSGPYRLTQTTIVVSVGRCVQHEWQNPAEIRELLWDGDGEKTAVMGTTNTVIPR